ncbi:hypothetical protein B6S44_04310 [Bosea sp. Tri-44]|uniref:hypothetical protein n=1 Tax=Bosea sp. Tri-44 TaxID=1972137 RepID=UPI00100F0BD4|nr:hypothetical protein [Bosea sp. Tri-44]RXT57638.1 hypothetical protein B6S44_04310 [Bosea sp. Tri-44]
MIYGSKIARHTTLRVPFAAAAIAVGVVTLGFGSSPAAAQSTSWEEGCAVRNVTPGPGDILRNYNCTRQKDCQQMANAQGSMMMGMGCFGVEPKGLAPVAQQAGKTRRSQHQ